MGLPAMALCAQVSHLLWPTLQRRGCSKSVRASLLWGLWSEHCQHLASTENVKFNSNSGSCQSNWAGLWCLEGWKVWFEVLQLDPGCLLEVNIVLRWLKFLMKQSWLFCSQAVKQLLLPQVILRKTIKPCVHRIKPARILFNPGKGSECRM